MAARRARASSLRRPSGVRVQPEATGFIAATRLPRAAKARHRAAATRVLPTPVSVPVTNRACGVIGRESWAPPRAQLLPDVIERYGHALSAVAPGVGGGRPGMAEYDFISSRQAAVLPIGLIRHLNPCAA